MKKYVEQYKVQEVVSILESYFHRNIDSSSVDPDVSTAILRDSSEEALILWKDVF